MSDFPPIVVAGCDAPAPTVYVTEWNGNEPVYGCRCVVCARCKRHTGNSNQGHYWGYCKVIGGPASKFHFCCPDDCELEVGDAA